MAQSIWNGSKKKTYIQHQEKAVEICGAHNEDRLLGEPDTRRTDREVCQRKAACSILNELEQNNGRTGFGRKNIKLIKGSIVHEDAGTSLPTPLRDTVHKESIISKRCLNQSWQEKICR